jgi:hypothetical protein
MDTLKIPLTPAQLEILKVLARPMTEQEIMELKRVIVQFFAQKLIQQANTVWDQNGWTPADSEQLSKRHLRTPYSDAGHWDKSFGY